MTTSNTQGFGLVKKVFRLAPYGLLTAYSAIALFPIVLIVLNSFKNQKSVFANPLAPPLPSTFTLDGYAMLLDRGEFPRYFFNSFVVAIGSLVLIILLGASVSFALGLYRFRGSRVTAFIFAIGLMIPIRLATISILQLMSALGLVDTLVALILVYTAQALPIAILILVPYYQATSQSLIEAAMVDGAGPYRIFRLTAPLIRPALAAVAVFVMIPIWNDLWFPLILASNERSKTIVLGIQRFFGQFETNWNAVLAALSVSMVPILILFVLFSRWLVAGLTSGSSKG